MANGAEVPLALLDDELHTAVGLQHPDKHVPGCRCGCDNARNYVDHPADCQCAACVGGSGQSS